MTEQETNRQSLEKTEDEYDIAVYNAAYKEYLDSGKQSQTIEKLWHELDL